MTPGEMSQEAAVRRIYDAFGRRDLPAVIAELHDAAEVDFSSSVGPERGTYPGREGVAKLLDLYWEAFVDISIEPERFAHGPNGVVAFVVVRGDGRASGVRVEARGPHLWRFRDGKPVRFTLFQDEADALDAAGIRE